MQRPASPGGLSVQEDEVVQKAGVVDGVRLEQGGTVAHEQGAKGLPEGTGRRWTRTVADSDTQGEGLQQATRRPFLRLHRTQIAVVTAGHGHGHGHGPIGRHAVDGAGSHDPPDPGGCRHDARGSGSVPHRRERERDAAGRWRAGSCWSSVAQCRPCCAKQRPSCCPIRGRAGSTSCLQIGDN